MTDRKVRYITHEEVLREEMKDWRFRFWYYALTPKYWLIRLCMWLLRKLE